MSLHATGKCAAVLQEGRAEPALYLRRERNRTRDLPDPGDGICHRATTAPNLLSPILPFIDATLLGGEPLPCLSMCDEHKDCKKEIVAPESPALIKEEPKATLLGFLGKRSTLPKPKTAQPKTDPKNRKRTFYNDPNAPGFASPCVRTPADPETFYGRRKCFDFTPPASSVELPERN